jgi:hypothetical protein
LGLSFPDTVGLYGCIAGRSSVLQVICKGWKLWDERVVDDVGRREAVSTTRLRGGLYIYLAMGPQVAKGACGHQQHLAKILLSG